MGAIAGTMDFGFLGTLSNEIHGLPWILASDVSLV